MFGVSMPGLSDQDRKRQLLRQLIGGAAGGAVPMDTGAPTGQESAPVLDPVPDNTPVGLKRLGEDQPRTTSPVTMMPPQAQDSATAAPAPLTGSRKSRAAAEAFDAAPAKPVGGFWHRLATGANKGLQTAREGGAPQSLGGFLGAAAGGAGYGAASPNGLAEWAKQRKSGQLWNAYGTDLKRDEGEQKYQQEIAKAQGEGLKNVKTGIDIQQQAAEPYIKSASAKGYMTDDEVQHIKNAYGVDVTDPNNGRYVSETRNGKTYIRRINDPRSVLDVTVPTELSEQSYETALPGQTQKIPLKPGQAASTAVGIAQANAGREERAATAAARVDEKNYETEDSFKQRQGKARSEAAAAKAELAQLTAARASAAENGESTSAMDARIAAAKGKIAAATTSLQEKYTPRPVSKGQVFTEGDARSYYQGKGKSQAEINDLIAKGRAQGVIR